MNNDNLIPISSRSREERREMGRKGGRESGRVRREKKALNDFVNRMLDLPVTNETVFNELLSMGIAPEDINNRMLVAVALFRRAVATGDPRAVREIRMILNDEDVRSESEVLYDILDAIRDIE